MLEKLYFNLPSTTGLFICENYFGWVPVNNLSEDMIKLIRTENFMPKLKSWAPVRKRTFFSATGEELFPTYWWAIQEKEIKKYKWVVGPHLTHTIRDIPEKGILYRSNWDKADQFFSGDTTQLPKLLPYKGDFPTVYIKTVKTGNMFYEELMEHEAVIQFWEVLLFPEPVARQDFRGLPIPSDKIRKGIKGGHWYRTTSTVGQELEGFSHSKGDPEETFQPIWVMEREMRKRARNRGSSSSSL